MRLTKIKLTHRGHRALLMFEDGSSIPFGVEDVVKDRLKVGMAVDASGLLGLKIKGYSQITFEKSLNFLSFRPRSVRETKTKLKEYLFKEKALSVEEKESISQKVLERLVNLKLLDDISFSKWYVAARLGSSKPRGINLVKTELLSKGITSTVIKEVLSEYDKDSNQDTLEKLAELKFAKLKEPNSFAARRKVIGFLLRKGFEQDRVFSVVDTLIKTKYNEARYKKQED